MAITMKFKINKIHNFQIDSEEPNRRKHTQKMVGILPEQEQ